MQHAIAPTSETGDAPGCGAAVEVLLAELFQSGVRVSAVDGVLRCSGPAHVLNGPIGARIRACKPDILDFLKTRGEADAAAPELRRLDLDAPPLSAAQRRLWMLEQLRPDAAHHIPIAVEATGRLDMAAVEHALGRIVARHEVLRTRIVMRDGAPTQHVLSAQPPVLRAESAGALDADGVRARLRDEAARPFDLAREPPIRALILSCAPGRAILAFTLHHIAADGPSLSLLMEEFAAFYREAAAGRAAEVPMLPVQYGDYAAWSTGPAQQDRIAADLRYWREALGAEPPVTRLPTDHPRPRVQSLRGGVAPMALSPDLTARLRALGAAQGVSLFAVLLTGFYLLVYRWTGQRDMVVGAPVAGRPPGAEALIGLFVNPLPLRGRIDPAAGFAANLAALRPRLMAAMEHRDAPFERLVEACQPVRDPGASPLFQLKFQLDRAPSEALELPGLTLRRLPREQALARHDLSLDLVETDQGVAGQIEYCADLFEPDTVAALADHYARLLQGAADAPDAPVAALPMLSPQERERQLGAWNDTRVEIDPAERFPALVERHAAARPDAIAVEHFADGARRAESYGALNSRANHLAHALRARGLGPDQVVAIAMERGPDMVAAWLGVLKSGAAYLPLDPSYPADRLAYMLADSGAALALCQSGVTLPGDVARWDLDRDWPESSAENPAPGDDPEDLAYLIYTSGSTGRPKGVEVAHAGLVNLARDKIRVCEVGPDDRVMGFFSFSFDASIPDLVMSLGAGARLVTASAADVTPGPGFAALLRQSRATHLTITPSALAATPHDDLPDLRLVLVGGEAPAPDLIARWGAGRRFVNAYGPTECTVNASMVVCAPDEPLCLRPPANKRLYVLDDALELLPVGCPGELCVGGLGLARGYRGMPGRTAAVFTPDPYGDAGARLYRTGDRAARRRDGAIRLLGRLDDQVKIRGYRVEPAELARACERHPAIAAATAAARDLHGRGLRLVVWLVARDAAAPRPDMKAELARSLPRHLLPDAVVWLDRMPLTANGKLDVRALPDPGPAQDKGRAPRGATECALASLFAEVLGTSAPSAEADFFDLGGDSLMATRLVAAIERRFGVRIRALELFEGATIAALAGRIARPEATPPREAGPAHWRADLALPDDIAPPAAPRHPHGLGDAVLLTGATGFVGGHLLAALLEAPARRVICLSRQADAESLRRMLTRRGLWRDAFDGRVEVSPGDLTAPDWGVVDGEMTRLAREITSILHCGARVHHLSPYRSLRAANVGGTVTAIRLAARAGAPLHHISTLSALGAGDAPVDESDPASGRAPPEGGYNLSKWVAEQLVEQAAARGLPTTIHRLGTVAGDTLRGALNPDDILALRLGAYLDLGAAPMGEGWVNLAPADYVARAVVTLASRPQSVGARFHLMHGAPVSAEALFAACAAEGRPIERVSRERWREMVERAVRETPDHPLARLAALGGAEAHGGSVWPYANDATRAALADDAPEPRMDAALLRLYVRDRLAAGYGA